MSIIWLNSICLLGMKFVLCVLPSKLSIIWCMTKLSVKSTSYAHCDCAMRMQTNEQCFALVWTNWGAHKMQLRQTKIKCKRKETNETAEETKQRHMQTQMIALWKLIETIEVANPISTTIIRSFAGSVPRYSFYIYRWLCVFSSVTCMRVYVLSRPVVIIR